MMGYVLLQINVVLAVVFFNGYCHCSVRLTKYGKVKGFVETVHGHKKLEKFFGIPYARPPLGNFRLEKPEPPLSWGDSLLDATQLPPACPQSREGMQYIDMHVPGFNRTSEDCLYLNVYIPKGTHSRSMPVLVFVHGGSYVYGMGAMLDGSMLAARGIVVVTFNYRLGPLGFLTAADDVIRGNYGMHDMIMALRWIQENIAHFNGDPGHVTIDGHSAGGCSVGLLLVSPLAKGLFHQVIQQSGSPLANWAVSRYQPGPDFTYKLFSLSLRCYNNSTEEVKRCIQDIDPETIMSHILERPMASLTPKYRPVVDGHFLPATPEELVMTGKFNANNFLTGSTRDEGLMAVRPLINQFGKGSTGLRKLLSLVSCFQGDLPEVAGIVDSVLDEYISIGYDDITEHEIETCFSEIVGDYFITAPTHLLADVLSRRNVSVYLYSYEYKPVLDQWDGVIHGAELFYLSGCPFTGHTNFRYDDTDKQMAQYLINIWSNFIRHGLPSLHPSEEFYFPRYTSELKLYSKIHATTEPVVTVLADLKHDKISFWNEKVPELFKSQRDIKLSPFSFCDVTTTRVVTYETDKHVWILAAVCICLTVLTLALTTGYYRTRTEISRLLRQCSISSGERILPHAV